MTPEEMAAKARRAIEEDGPRAEMLVVVPGRDLTEPINVLPGVQGRFISEEPRGTVVYVSAAAVLAVLAVGGLIRVEPRLIKTTETRPIP
jgi:hypothetical protein